MNASPPDILLAEDSPTTAELFVYAFEATAPKVTVQVVRDGVEVLDFLFGSATHPEETRPLPRLVLLDLHMPRLGGLEVLERLRADERTRILPVVILSSSELESDEHEAYRLGANGYIKKPKGLKESCTAIARLERDWLKVEGVPQHPPG